jgi:hypothetical protein
MCYTASYPLRQEIAVPCQKLGVEAWGKSQVHNSLDE